MTERKNTQNKINNRLNLQQKKLVNLKTQQQEVFKMKQIKGTENTGVNNYAVKQPQAA